MTSNAFLGLHYFVGWMDESLGWGLSIVEAHVDLEVGKMKVAKAKSCLKIYVGWC